jgi:hypothetical protein
MSLRKCLFFAWATFLLPGQVCASGPARSAGTLDFSVHFESQFRYDDNVYHFSDDQEDRFDDKDPGNEANGRFDDMDSTDDWIWRPGLWFELEAPGIGKNNDFHIEPWLEYDLYFRNDERRHVRTGLDLRHELPGPQDLRLDFRYIGEKLRKNYFVDSVDDPGDNVRLDERIYRPAFYQEWRLGAAFQRKLWSVKRKKGSCAPRALYGEIGLRAEWRRFNRTHRNRDYDSIGPLVEFRTEARNWSLGLRYVFTDRIAPNDFENILVEKRSGDNVVMRTRVDRSRFDHELRLEGRWEFLPRSHVRVRYDWRYSDYESENPRDAAYFERRDSRQRIDVEFGYRWNRMLRLDAGVRWTDDDTRAPFDPIDDEEQNDYRQLIVRFGFRVEFF